MNLTPTEYDVLCGRGPKSFKHPGNQKLRTRIVLSLERYDKCESRKEKTLLIREIIQSIMNEGGRFLKFDKTNNCWFDGGVKAARSRVGFAFRDARTPDKVKCIEKLKEYLSNASFDGLNASNGALKLPLQRKISLTTSSCISPRSIAEVSDDESLLDDDFLLDCYEPRPIGSYHYDNADDVDFAEAKSFLKNLLVAEMQSNGILTIGK